MPDVARNQVRSFGLIAVIFVVLLLVALAASWAAIEVVNATRSYATGEGRYSKAEKIAVLHLHRFAYSGRASDYAAFLQAIALPRGDRMGRLALERSPPDLATAAEGFLMGENHSDDVNGMIRLFRGFAWWGPFAAAVADWREGDLLVGELLEQGTRLAAGVAEGTLDSESRIAELDKIDRIDDRLTLLENTFSTHLGEAARAATMLVVLGLGATTVLLWAGGMAFATRLFRQQLALDRQLGSSEQRFRDYAQVASDWYWETDGENRIVYMSERFYVLTTAHPALVLGRNAADYVREHADEVEHRRYEGAVANREPFRGLRVRFVRDDKTKGYLAISGMPHRDDSGAFLGYRGVGSDITPIVQHAEMLRHAKERAEVANRAKSAFLANMSHELRTPLNAILGFSDIIANRQFGPGALDRYAGYATDIHDSGRHLLAIIDDILDLSKIEAGHAELSETEIGLGEIVGAVRIMFDDRFGTAELALAIEMPDPEPQLRVDPRKLKQCLINLLSNALKFTPRGGSVTIAAAVTARSGLVITVRDTGIGIAPQDIETALTPFGQVESAFSREHHGTGLGLPLSRSLMELHGGTLMLTSTPGAGTTVTLSLPPERVLPRLPLGAEAVRALA